MTGEVTLLPEGTLIEVSPWRRWAFWLLAIVGILFSLNEAARAFETGGLSYALTLYWLGSAAVFSRFPLLGVTIERSGIKLRAAIRNHHLQWGEIERFELTEKRVNRLRIHLRDGGEMEAGGFTAHSASEEERCQALFKALEERLRIEQGTAR